jgi:hypothetical protein
VDTQENRFFHKRIFVNAACRSLFVHTNSLHKIIC